MKRILIIEDEKDLREALQTKLISCGYRVETAETSELGLRAVIAEKPDLILLDILTHSLHASLFLDRLNDLSSAKETCKVIVLTNLDDQDTKQKMMSFGVVAYLVKAKTSLEEVANKVKEVLGE